MKGDNWTTWGRVGTVVITLKPRRVAFENEYGLDRLIRTTP